MRSTQTTVRTTTARTTPPVWTGSTTTCVCAHPTTRVSARRPGRAAVWGPGWACHALEETPVCAQTSPTLQAPRTAACQLLSMGFSRQEYWSVWPFPSPGIFPTQGSNQRLLCLLCWPAGSLPLLSLGSPPRSRLLPKTPPPFPLWTKT